MAAVPAPVLKRDLADLLVQLSIALHKHAIYPPGHPMMAQAADELAIQLDAVLARQDSLSLGVARQQLVIEGVATDSRNPLLRDLASRLNRHRLAGVRFRRGVTPLELAEFLDAASTDPDVGGVVLGRSPRSWPHVTLFPLTVGQLALVDDEDAVVSAADAKGDGGLATLWIGLARAAMADGSPVPAEPDLDAAADPTEVAQAIERHEKDEAYDQVVVGYLLQIAEEMRDRPPGESVAVSRRVSKLVAELRPETIRRLLSMGGDARQRRDFMLSASHGFSADAVVKLVEAATAGGMSGTVSESMLRLLAKLARNAGEATGGPADAAVREQVQSLLADWTLADPNPGEYRRMLEAMARADAATVEDAGVDGQEDERLVLMGLEIGTAGTRVRLAAGRMWDDRRAARLVAILDAAPESARPVVEAIWDEVATEARLRALLAADRFEGELVDRLTRRLGVAAAEPLLDALQEAQDRSRRARLLDQLAALGEPLGPVLVARLEGSPWFVQRNVLVLLGRLPALPAGFDPRPWAEAEDPRVRREAIKLLLRDGERREQAVLRALADPDPGIVHLGVATAAQHPVPSAGDALARIAESTLEAPTRALAVRALSAVAHPDTRALVLRLAAPRRALFRGVRVAPPSPVTAAALVALAERWADDPEALAVLRAAEREGLAMRAISGAWVVTTAATGSTRGER